MNGSSSKIPTAPPLPLCGTSPRGGSKGLCGFALVRSKWDSAYRRKPLRRYAPPPLSGEVFLALLKGELAGPKGLTEGFRGRDLRFYETLGEFVQAPPWLPNGGAGRPNGLTEGVWFVEW